MSSPRIRIVTQERDAHMDVHSVIDIIEHDVPTLSEPLRDAAEKTRWEGVVATFRRTLMKSVGHYADMLVTGRADKVSMFRMNDARQAEDASITVTPGMDRKALMRAIGRRVSRILAGESVEITLVRGHL